MSHAGRLTSGDETFDRPLAWIIGDEGGMFGLAFRHQTASRNRAPSHRRDHAEAASHAHAHASAERSGMVDKPSVTGVPRLTEKSGAAANRWRRRRLASNTRAVWQLCWAGSTLRSNIDFTRGLQLDLARQKRILRQRGDRRQGHALVSRGLEAKKNTVGSL